jgi:hypothetical protein
VVLDRRRENDFHGAFEEWNKTMGLLYIFPRGLLKDIAAEIVY